MKRTLYIGGEYMNIEEEKEKLAKFRYKLYKEELRKSTDFNKLKQIQFFCNALASQIKIKYQLQQDEFVGDTEYNIVLLKLPELYFSLMLYSDIARERLAELREAAQIAATLEKYKRFHNLKGEDLIEAIANTLILL